MNWDGYEIYQNINFARIYSKYLNNNVRKINNSIVYITHSPVFGYTFLELLFPKKENLEKTIETCITFCVDNKIPRMVLKTPYSSTVKKLKIERIIDKDYTIILDLTKDLDILWKSLKKKTRQKIKQGEKKGLKCIIGDIDDFKLWWELYSSAAQRIGFPLTELGIAYATFLNKTISKLFICKKDTKLACGTLILLSKRGILAWLGASDPNLLEYKPNYILQWEIIKWGKNNGFLYLDLGGIKKDDFDHGPTFFKSGWGGEIKEYYVYELGFPSIKAQMIEISRRIVPKKVKSTIRKKLKGLSNGKSLGKT